MMCTTILLESLECGLLIAKTTPRRLITGKTVGAGRRSISSVPQQADLLERYRGLVTLGKVQYDEEQVRVVMQLRRLQKALAGYSPPAVASRYIQGRVSDDESQDQITPWWEASEKDSDQTTNLRALVRVRTHAEDIAGLTTPKGLLLTGPPGAGKSMLIDMWFSAMPTAFKARKHYSELVLEIYRAVWEETRRRMAAIHSDGTHGRPTPRETSSWTKAIRDRWRELSKSGSLPERWRRSSSRTSYAISSSDPTIAFVVAQRLVLRHWLLVFDEIQLLDVSSATLLADVLSWFWRMGGVIVGTSNKVPDDLYKNGVQRDRLEPFVEALKARCPVVIMRSEQDWRETRAKDTATSSWFVYGQRSAFERYLHRLAGTDVEPSPRDLTIFGRSLRVPWSAGGVSKFTFSELCDESLGPADYITLASTYRTVAITSIPVLPLSAKNQARRFISLIDALYEARCHIVCLAEARPEDLFFPDAPAALASDSETARDVDVMMAEAVAESRDVYRPNVSSYNAPNMAEAPVAPSALALNTLSIFSGQDEQFAFKRALSRLLEMTSAGYATDEQWRPLPEDLRKWERTSASREGRRGPSALRWEPPLGEAEGDFATEASNEGQVPAHPERPEAPRLDEAHIWGVRDDWGARAKTWGRGAKAYERSGRRATK